MVTNNYVKGLVIGLKEGEQFPELEMNRGRLTKIPITTLYVVLYDALRKRRCLNAHGVSLLHSVRNIALR